jgi:sulfur carrier protein
VVISVNDANREVGPASTVEALLGEIGLAERPGIAVAVNGSLVPRSAWRIVELRDADRVLVLRATAGG